jgi:hypothetical protein
MSQRPAIYSSGEKQLHVIRGMEGEQFKSREWLFGLTLKNGTHVLKGEGAVFSQKKKQRSTCLPKPLNLTK